MLARGCDDGGDDGARRRGGDGGARAHLRDDGGDCVRRARDDAAFRRFCQICRFP